MPIAGVVVGFLFSGDYERFPGISLSPLCNFESSKRHEKSYLLSLPLASESVGSEVLETFSSSSSSLPLPFSGSATE
jgi:hypothetical protein